MSEGTIQRQWLRQIADRKEYMAYQIASLLTAPFKIISYARSLPTYPIWQVQEKFTTLV